MKKLVYFLFSGMFAAILFFGSCEKVVYPPIEIPDSVNYKADIQPIWDKNCLDCHSTGLPPTLTADVSHSQLINGGYVNTDIPMESELMIKLYTSPHDARATEAEKQSILVWIEEGALDN
ncbi:MAG TPA: hypothetical protein ENI20_15380 [Bacteroides sp.]|nr:hypothetical protein [Bacteroides sp.]